MQNAARGAGTSPARGRGFRSRSEVDWVRNVLNRALHIYMLHEHNILQPPSKPSSPVSFLSITVRFLFNFTRTKSLGGVRKELLSVMVYQDRRNRRQGCRHRRCTHSRSSYFLFCDLVADHTGPRCQGEEDMSYHIGIYASVPSPSSALIPFGFT